jgi:exoribonuclease-2
MFAFRKLLKRTQMRAIVQPHAGLGLPVYSQVTSPLRRYLDLVAHQQLRAWTLGAPLLDYEHVLERVGAAEAVIGSLRQAERSSNRHWTLVSLMRSPGWKGEGVVVDRRRPRATVLIPTLALEASVHLDRDVPLDGALALTLTGVDLPSLAAHFAAAD